MTSADRTVRARGVPTLPTRARPGAPPAQVTDGLGESARRPDATLKVKGEFAYSSDLWAEGMLWGTTVRSPHPRAKIRSVDVSAALTVAGVATVLTAQDVPGRKTYGMEVPDQPVLAWDDVRYQGEAVAIVAADHPETARRAAALVQVDYEVLPPLVDPEFAMTEDAPRLHPSGNELKYVPIRHGDQAPTADVVVAGTYDVGMQDQAPLGPESGLAIPDGEGGVDLYVATQWLHVDQDQLTASLGLRPAQVRLTMAGIGGAFGAREDISIQIHACLLALRTGRPVKMMYTREESFYGHVHRHPARMTYEHGASRDGKLVYVKARLVFDGGAYASSSNAVCLNASTFACGPYDVPNATIDGYVVYTNNPPCGAMRGFGAVQACFGYESQMDKLAAALDMDPVELRIINAMSTGTSLPTGQRIDGPAPVAAILRSLAAMPLPADADGGRDLRALPGGVSNTTHGEGVRRGVGYAVGLKNVAFSAGFDDYATARVRLSVVAGEPQAEVHSAAAEVGQGVVTIQAQIVRTELGIQRVVVLPADTQVGSAGSSSASRQTWMTGGAVQAACAAVRHRVVELARAKFGDVGELTLTDGQVGSEATGPLASLAQLLGNEVVEEAQEYRHRPTADLDPVTGQGDAHVAFLFAGHRAVVDVDTELGLVKVVEMATTQDVGRALNPQAVQGQIQGGTAQGMGLALMEEIQVVDGKLRNPSFTDYLIPTILDMPPVRLDVLELGDPESPYGVKGVGEPPTISSPAAVAAALRNATGRPLPRIPVRPEHLIGMA
jgi:xanthine dehydrogenase D subunit